MVNISGSVSSEQKAALVGLRNSILENPSEDDLRLIYADLLDDTGNSLYADFIRKQIELHQTKISNRTTDPNNPLLKDHIHASRQRTDRLCSECVHYASHRKLIHHGEA